jgi:hypothetical protein
MRLRTGSSTPGCCNQPATRGSNAWPAEGGSEVFGCWNVLRARGTAISHGCEILAAVSARV